MLFSDDHSDLILAQRKLPKQATKANTFTMKLVGKAVAFSPRHLKKFGDKFGSTMKTTSEENNLHKEK